ncbi:EF-hand domain-containing family member B-like [Calliphora vicina]|uniref:EF-hand domain-containing family member B-like n=1 Tax=Calliphora vicina TaxID=7373 RepID=UPI00325BAD4B
MSNEGKYIDRNPDIQTAGKLLLSQETVGDTLKICSTEEAAFNIMNLKCQKQRQQSQANTSLGYSQFLPTESLKELLSPESKKSRFVAFREKFSEDMFFKKPELGQAFPLQSKPQEFTNENFTYGLKNDKSERAYDLICPDKTPEEVKRDFLKWHDKYLISHKHYLPSERINRNYNPHFNPHAVFGLSNNVDKTGIMVKKCLQQCDRMVAINKAQKLFQDRTAGQLGERIDRYNLNLDPHLTFGIQTKNRSKCDVRTLIENVEPCAKNTKIIEAISYINKLRRLLFNRTDFHMNDLKLLLNKYDEKETGFIAFQSIMKTLRTLRIHANEEKIRLAITHFEMMKDDNEASELVDLKEFWKMLHIQYPLPRKSVLSKELKRDEDKQTTYRLLCSDRQTTVPLEPVSHKQNNDDDRTRASDLITPDIPMHYGLVPSDFEVLRPKEELKRIFKRLLPQNFEQVWQFAWAKKCGEATCQMSVNEFRAIMQEYNQNLK